MKPILMVEADTPGALAVEPAEPVEPTVVADDPTGAEPDDDVVADELLLLLLEQAETAKAAIAATAAT
jgi:hypothetical protein